MKLSVISFTKKGMLLSKRLAEALDTGEIVLYSKHSGEPETESQYVLMPVEERIGEWTGKQMKEKNALLFIGACGIAVRAIAPFVTDKLHDGPVLVMDEKGEYVIPLLSGHIGGANELAYRIAEKTGAVPVITTATDINEKFAVDLFAKKNGLRIVNKEGIARVSSKVLAEKEITMSIESGHWNESGNIPKGIRMISYPPREFVDIVISTSTENFDAAIRLEPREYVVGMGCRKGREAGKIAALITKSMGELGISQDQILAIASIDVKKEEQGILSWSRENNVPFITYAADELMKVKGDFHPSAFVMERVGVDNVCERAAVKACGEGRLILDKRAEEGMTIAVAKREWSVVFDGK
jgi:cobalt-precorrin 5A hydrolase